MMWWFISIGGGVMIGYLTLLLCEDRRGRRLVAVTWREQLDHLLEEVWFRSWVLVQRISRVSQTTVPRVPARPWRTVRTRSRVYVTHAVNDSVLGQILTHKEVTRLSEQQRKKALRQALEGTDN